MTSMQHHPISFFFNNSPTHNALISLFLSFDAIFIIYNIQVAFNSCLTANNTIRVMI